MRPASFIGIGILAFIAALLGLPSVDGQITGQPPAPGPKKGHLIIAGEKEYEMLAQYPEMKATFRSYDPDKSLIKVRVDYPHAPKENKEEYERAEKTYKDTLAQLGQRFQQLQQERAKYSKDKNRVQDLNRQAEQIATDKRTADNQFQQTTKNIQMVKDVIEFELAVAKDAPIRKMWSPKVFDDKGKVRDMTKEERAKYKGADPKMAGWIAKLENFDMSTPVTITLRPSAAMLKGEPDLEVEPVNSQTPPATTPTAPVPPGPNADPANEKKRDVKVEDRPVVSKIIALSDPTPTTVGGAKKN